MQHDSCYSSGYPLLSCLPWKGHRRKARSSQYDAVCSNALEDPWVEPSEDMFTRSVSPEQAPDKPTYIEVDFEKGDPVAIDGVLLSPATLLAQLNKVSQLPLPHGEYPPLPYAGHCLGVPTVPSAYPLFTLLGFPSNKSTADTH